MPERSEFEFWSPSVIGLDALEPSVGDRLTVFDTKLIIAFDFPPHIPLLQVFLPAFAPSSRF